MNKKLSLSIVSHGHRDYIASLLTQLAALPRSDFEVILTLNMPEPLPVELATLPYPVHLVVNDKPRGFSANHNAAFALSSGEVFVILNPDIKLLEDPFTSMLSLLKDNGTCICAPLIVSKEGVIENSARNFPSPYLLLRKLSGRIFKYSLAPEAVPEDDAVLMPDWAAGMFLAVRRDTYTMLNGFNENYFLYFEDVDFCARARLAGCRILVCKHTRVIHEAQRDSHRKLRFLLWHLESAFKFFISSVYMKIQFNRIFFDK
jgi:N-acetylglucosaminyl-diphospho-decaprenol L-rhamnosyltransferase